MMKRFGTFEGVFTPCLLSILGVIMYLRLGWVVGSVGLGGALMIICFANIITLLTTLSMSSVITNIRIGDGGAYSIITKSLGIEAGGAIGIPLYFSQAISIAFYIVGFSECWISVFPYHQALLVSISVWFIILLVSYLSAKLAFRLQFGIMAFIAFSIISILMGKDGLPVNPQVWDYFGSGNFWSVFAVFFPAVTGVLAGATMSGELREPKESIPKGTFGAIAVSFIVYLGLAIWLSGQVPRAGLLGNTSILIEVGRWKWLVVAGIMGATISSAISMFVSSPRTLLALGKHSVVPLSSHFSHTNSRGEPSTAILFTALLALLTLLFGTLNTVAILLTMFFLITYGMINFTVLIEQTIGIASFRPTLRVPRILSFLGGVGCLAVMFLVNAKFTIIAILIIAVTYIILVRRGLKTYSPDVRSGILVFIAEQFAKAAAKLPYHPKIWKPNLLVPVASDEELTPIVSLAKSIAYPSGRIHLCSVKEGKERRDSQKSISSITESLKEEGMFSESSVVESTDFASGIVTVMQNLKGVYFPPNTVFCSLLSEDKDAGVRKIVKKATEEGMGSIVLLHNPKVGFGEEKNINLWIRRESPNINLAILIALQLEKNWEGKVRILQAIREGEDVEEARSYLERMKTLVRLPLDAEANVLVGEFKEILSQSPPTDINILGMPDEPDFPMMREVFRSMNTSVLFLRDSKQESAMA